jgi:hypothetical protein
VLDLITEGEGRHFARFERNRAAVAAMVPTGGHHSMQEVARSRMNRISIYPHPHRRRIEIVNPGKEIRYSSPWPWILAIVLSLMLWAMLGWYLWWLFH